MVVLSEKITVTRTHFWERKTLFYIQSQPRYHCPAYFVMFKMEFFLVFSFQLFMFSFPQVTFKFGTTFNLSLELIRRLTGKVVQITFCSCCHYYLSLFCSRTVYECPNSLRGRFGLTDTRNSMHGSGT